MPLNTYIAELNRQFQTGTATEHTYRPALSVFLSALLPNLTVSNEPKRQQCGAPDFVLLRQRDKIPVGYIEAKDINDTDLDGINSKGNREQFDRYKKALDNIIFTDYLQFNFCKKGQIVERLRIAEVSSGKIKPIRENDAKFLQFITQFGESIPQTISSSIELAKIMAAKARLMADVFEQTLSDGGERNELLNQMLVFKKILVEDITEKAFADLYAQTITYGMFAARLHDKTPQDFTRIKAGGLIPATNPLLRRLFQQIATYELDERIAWIVDDLTDVFRVTDIETVMQGGLGEHLDPIFHFYENFLTEYDPDLRKSRGVYYTPPAVVNFIVRAVDEILKNDFKLPDGLADREKISVNLSNQKKMYHKVQVLDPATGTGTFLAETVRHIHKSFQNNQGMWSDYVKEHLIPRLNGFELLMAPYAMAHLELDWLLTETGYKGTDNQRLNIFLTNSLSHSKLAEMLPGLYQWLTDEAQQADTIKQNVPVMVILGNPPYSGISKNNSEWIMELMGSYKKEPGTDNALQERNSKWINDDYVKFIRLGQHFVDKNKVGILAYINNHSFIDNPTFRGMRYNLMKSFDQIYVLDLHGNSKKKEKAPDGGKDENVFNIQQGVSINIFVKTGKKKVDALAKVYHADLFGLRDHKYSYLQSHSLLNTKDKSDIKHVPFRELQPSTPEYFFVPKDNRGKDIYMQGFSVAELFPVNVVGMFTARDGFTIHESSKTVQDVIKDFLSITDEEAREKYKLGKDVRDWSVARARADLQSGKHKIVQIAYRPFDTRFTSYSGKSTGFHCMPRPKFMKHYFEGENLGLILNKHIKTNHIAHIFITKDMPDLHLLETANASLYSYPLYLYPDSNVFSNILPTPNLNEEIVKTMADGMGLKFDVDAEPFTKGSRNRFAPIDILDYIYAILHSPGYRETYKEFLKIDFPRVPYPTDATEFRRLVKLGAELRQLHLMEHPALAKPDTTYPEPGNHNVDKPEWKPDESGETGKVWINSKQYFGNVPLVAWGFYIGGYQPAQKWLKDRKGRKLTIDEIEHYQKIIAALAKTYEIQCAIVWQCDYGH